MPEQRVVQDDIRERMIAAHCGLKHVGGRAGVDATDGVGNPFELKSGTKSGITTARDVGLHTIKEWRSKYWIIATGRNLAEGFRLDSLYIVHPDDLEPVFSKLAARLQADSERVAAVLDAAKAASLAKETVERVADICRRGITINNPKIPMDLVQRQATHNPAKARRQVKAFVLDHPLKK